MPEPCGSAREPCGSPLLEAPMPDTTTTRAAELLAEHRESIDRLDAILVFTLAERFKHTQAVGRLKAEQIERLEDLAKSADLDPDFAREFLNFIIAEVIRHHRKQQS